jgi:hypothetical protein
VAERTLPPADLRFPLASQIGVSLFPAGQHLERDGVPPGPVVRFHDQLRGRTILCQVFC